MIQLLLLPVAGPALASLLVLFFPDTPEGRRSARWAAIVGCEAGVGAAIAALVRALRFGPFGRAGLVADPFRVGLSLAALLVCGAAIVVLARAPRATALLLLGAGAGAGMPLAYHAVAAGSLLLVTSMTLVGLAWVTRSRTAMTAAGWYIAADAAAIAGLTLASGGGSAVPLIARGAGAALMLAAAAVLAGMVPATSRLIDRDEAAGAIALGPNRAHAIVIATWVGFGSGGPAKAMLIGAAIAGMWFAREAARNASASAAQSTLVAMVLCGIGLATVAGREGAVLLAAGMFIGTVVMILGRAADAGAPSIAVVPLGAVLPGAIVVVTAVADRALASRTVFAAAAPLSIALLWLTAAGAAGMRMRTGAALAWSVLPLAALGAIAVLPHSALSGIAGPVGPFLGAPRALAALPGAMSDSTGIMLAVAGMLGALVARGSAPRVIEPPLVAPAPALPMRWIAAVWLVAAGWLAALLWVGIRRGFL